MISKASNWQRQPLANNLNVTNKVSDLLAQIEAQGDAVIESLAMEFDGQPVSEIELQEFDSYQLQSDLSNAIQLAAKRIENFARFQMQGLESRTFEDEFGSYGQVVSPIERIGAYIPGGRFPLISTALMTLIPARIAGCSTRIAVSPSAHPAILAAASLAGATRFFQIGGVQAIAALAMGYKDLESVDMIVGPGNAWVNEAKKQLQSKVKIDGLAGPSELLAICDGEQNIEWLALDALAQAEHDPDACSLIVSDDSNWLVEMLSFLEKDPDGKALIDNRQVELIYAESPDELIDFCNTYAPEHLMLCHAQIEVSDLQHYGALFEGANSAVALGDYISGPNHTLPTLAYARQTGGLNVNAFLRVQTRQQINDTGRIRLSQSAANIAHAEGLTFHRRSLEVRAREASK